MTLDPDGCTFWYTNEYYATDGLNYLTAIGSFAYPECTPVGSGGTVQGTVTTSPGGAPLSGATVALGSPDDHHRWQRPVLVHWHSGWHVSPHNGQRCWLCLSGLHRHRRRRQHHDDARFWAGRRPNQRVPGRYNPG